MAGRAGRAWALPTSPPREAILEHITLGPAAPSAAASSPGRSWTQDSPRMELKWQKNGAVVASYVRQVRRRDAGKLRAVSGWARRGWRSRGTAAGSQASHADGGRPGDVAQTLPSGPGNGAERVRLCLGTVSFQ